MRNLVLFAVLPAIGAIAPAAAANSNPAAIEEIDAGTRTVADAAWWGFNTDDATETLQSAIDSRAETVIVPYLGSPWIVRPLKLRSNLTIQFEPGVVVEAKRGEFQGKGDSLFAGANLENVRLLGYGATLRMHKEDYRKEPYAKAEWRMVLSLGSCTNVTVEGLRLESSGGDGIYVGVANKEQPYCKDIVIRNVTCSDNYRQGISVISAENLLIENCVMEGTEGTAPAAGIDFEPNNENERLVNCVVRHCSFADNQGAGILVYLKPLKATSAPISLSFESCLVRDGQNDGIIVGAIGDDGPQGAIAFKNCTVKGANGSSVRVYDKSAASAHVYFTDCTFNMRGNDDAGDAPIRILLSRPELTRQPGGIDFENCVVIDDLDRPFLNYGSKDETIGLRAVHGAVHVLNPHGARVDVKDNATDVTVGVN